jgi:hypothetical protein
MDLILITPIQFNFSRNNWKDKQNSLNQVNHIQIGAKQDASRIRTAIRLMDKVYDEEYSTEWPDILREKYGDDVLNWDWEETSQGSGLSYHRWKYESWDNAEEIRQVKLDLISKGEAKQKRAEQLVWKFIGHNIRYWWD